MATQTPNLGLTLPVGTENVSRTVINGNNTLIDTFAGGVNTAMDQMGANLGILETGDTATHAIAKGEYVTWKGASYTADAAISIGETLAATGGSKNLTACDKGIANALNSNSRTLLWTNSNPSASFASQDISIDTTTYNYILVVGVSMNSLLLPTGYDTSGNTYQYTSNGFVRRKITVYNDRVHFDTAYYSAGTVSNADCIPSYIFGMK